MVSPYFFRQIIALMFLLTACSGCYEQRERHSGHVATSFAIRKVEEAEVRIAEKDFAAALALADEAVADDPEFATAHAMRGNALGRLGRFAEASEAMARAIAIDPAMPSLPTVRGVYLERMGNLDGALAEYKKGLELYERLKAKQRLSPDDSLGWAATVFLLKGKTEGIVAFNEVIGQYPKLHPALYLKDRVRNNDREYFMRWTMKEEKGADG